MIPLFILAGRNNPLIWLLNISFDTFNLFHRWLGRLVVIEALIHTIAWGANKQQAVGMKGALSSFRGDTFLILGLVGTLSMGIMFFQTWGALRHAFYETFKAVHQVLAVAALIGVYVHLDVANLGPLRFARVVVAYVVFERACRVYLWVRMNVSRQGRTQCVVEALSNEACRVTFQIPRHIVIRPGSHIYAHFPLIAPMESHPFSVAWTNVGSEPPTGIRPDEPPTTPGLAEKQTSQPYYKHDKEMTKISLIIQAQTGMTRKLYDKAAASPQGIFRPTGFLEGPYSGHDSLHSYGTVFLFAGGAGVTHHLVQIRHLLGSAVAGTVATRKIHFIWSVRSSEMLSWVKPWMNEIMAMPQRKEILNITLFVTKPSGPISNTRSITVTAGRCKPGAVLDAHLPKRVGATAISVCGPGAFADEVRAAYRERVGTIQLDFLEEAFTW